MTAGWKPAGPWKNAAPLPGAEREEKGSGAGSPAYKEKKGPGGDRPGLETTGSVVDYLEPFLNSSSESSSWLTISFICSLLDSLASLTAFSWVSTALALSPFTK